MNTKIRFALVGAVNTAVDVVILFVLAVGFGVVPFLANVVSTSAALVTSYMLNKKAVFRDADAKRAKQFAAFVAVTLVGIWGIQGGVIWGVGAAARELFGAEGAAVLLAAKAIATVFTLTWNYLWYSRVIFAKRNDAQ